MKSAFFSLAAVFMFAVITVPLAQAAESPQVDTTLIGNTVIDLDWEDRDRLVRVYSNFVNFDSNDEYYSVNIVQMSTGDVVSASKVNVITTAEGLVSFGSMAGYLVNDLDICADEISEDEPEPLCTNAMTGDYEIQLKTKDGSLVGSESFTIIDTRF